MVASTIMTAPSTINPKSIAPKLIRLPDTPNRFMSEKAKSRASGITEATISPALKLPSKSSKTKMTIKAPSIRFLLTVPMALSTSLDRSKKGSKVTPSGNVSLISSIFDLTLSITSAEFSPFSIITIALTTSPSPFLVVDP